LIFEEQVREIKKVHSNNSEEEKKFTHQVNVVVCAFQLLLGALASDSRDVLHFPAAVLVYMYKLCIER
jgi:hypothetical protein